MAYCQFSTKPLPKPMLTYWQLDLLEMISMKLKLKYISKCLKNGGHYYVPASMCQRPSSYVTAGRLNTNMPSYQ